MKAEQAATHVPHWVDDRPPTVEEVGNGDWTVCKTKIRDRDSNRGDWIRGAWSAGDCYPWLANVPPYVKAERFKVVECPSLSKPNKFAVRDIKKTAVFYEAVGIPTREDAEAIKAIYERGAK